MKRPAFFHSSVLLVSGRISVFVSPAAAFILDVRREHMAGAKQTQNHWLSGCECKPALSYCLPGVL